MHGPVKEDPAIERFNLMRESAYLRFKWTPATLRTAIMGFILVPGTIYYLADRYQLRWDWVAARRDRPLNIAAAKARSEEN